MAEYIKRTDVMKICEGYSQHCFLSNDSNGQDIADRILDDVVEIPTADVVEVEKVAEILVDVTGIAPCEMVSANEWDYDYCNCAELCSQLNYKQCWERYLKHSKG